MLKPLMTAFAFAMLTQPALSAEDPVATRKALMQNNGAAAALAGGMMKGEIAYSPAAGKAAIAAINATAVTMGDYFPGGSDTDPSTTASPKIWEDMAGFQEEVASLQAATAAALEVSGKAGPADLAAFQEAMGPILGTCRACHEGYRVQK